MKNVEEHWKRRATNISEEITNLAKRVMTWEAKALLTKTKLFPLISYTSIAYPIPTRIKEKLVQN